MFSPFQIQSLNKQPRSKSNTVQMEVGAVVGATEVGDDVIGAAGAQQCENSSRLQTDGSLSVGSWGMQAPGDSISQQKP
jgi:hypothetical protein